MDSSGDFHVGESSVSSEPGKALNVNRDFGMVQTQIPALCQVPDRAGTLILIDQSLDVNAMQKQLRMVNRSLG